MKQTLIGSIIRQFKRDHRWTDGEDCRSIAQ
jgi:hypothetical protein